MKMAPHIQLEHLVRRARRRMCDSHFQRRPTKRLNIISRYGVRVGQEEREYDEPAVLTL